MYKVTEAVIAAAVIAGIFTAATRPGDHFDVSPVAVSETGKACTQEPWPYLNCVGTPSGNRQVRVIRSN